MKFFHLIFILCGSLIGTLSVQQEGSDEERRESAMPIGWRSPSLRMMFAIKEYARKYDIPDSIAFAFAWHETRYEGPNHRGYNHRLISSAGALGPMQIMPVAGRNFCPSRYSDSMMLNDIEYNVATSMKLIRYLKDRFGTWERAAGAYNTGQPVSNEYARGVARGYYRWR
jgi:soluble lytic murein transglycosylase-like protein